MNEWKDGNEERQITGSNNLHSPFIKANATEGKEETAQKV